MPVTFWVYLIGALALAGIAPLAGFFSKDEILAAASQSQCLAIYCSADRGFSDRFLYGTASLAGVLWQTAQRRMRNMPAKILPVITLPLVVLAVLSVSGRAVEFPRQPALEHWLEHTLGKGLEAGFNLPVAACLCWIALARVWSAAWMVYGRKSVQCW